jgi:hypothetical protein
MRRRSSTWRSRPVSRGWLAACLTLALLATGCDTLPSLPVNPFRVTPTVVPTATPTVVPVAVAVASPTATVPAFEPYWVRNHRLTEMWSGPSGQEGVISFGVTSAQFCAFQVTRPQDNSRLYVLNPYSRDYFWIDADAVGPIPEPPRQVAGPKPADQNCAEDIYEG